MSRTGLRKQRTRQHVIADLSVHHVEGFILAEGHTAQRVDRDYGYDLILSTFDEQGYVEPGLLFIQIKAAESLRRNGRHYVYDLDIRDYNLWTWERLPVILILFDVGKKRSYWLPIQEYFRENPARKPKQGNRTIRVLVPNGQAVNCEAIARMRELKRVAQLPAIFGGE